MDEQHIGEKAVKIFEFAAREHLEKKEEAGSLLFEVALKANETKGALGGAWEKLDLLVSVLRDWLNGNYTQIPSASLTLVVTALLYFVSHVDFVPGSCVDDALVISYISDQISTDLDKYTAWKAAQISI